MTTTTPTPETKAAPRKGIVPNIISGLATGLFSIPEGMAYAQLADVNPNVIEIMKKNGLLEILGEANVIPTTERVLEAENQAWNMGQKWLMENGKTTH